MTIIIADNYKKKYFISLMDLIDYCNLKKSFTRKIIIKNIPRKNPPTKQKRMIIKSEVLAVL